MSYLHLLHKKLPDDVLLNFGKNGDTVQGLQKRIQKLRFKQIADLGFIWIGTNEILVQSSWSYDVYKKLYKKPWSKYQDELKKEYHSILDILTKKNSYIITVPPILIGEDPTSRWNQELGEMAEMIKELSATYNNVEYLDLRNLFIKQLPKKTHSQSAS